ncbi:hypothetical protein GC387_04800 [Pseudomonas sp. MWU12-2323]|nr:hypothetical protein [Pseudomonas sp. MWU12-2323]
MPVTPLKTPCSPVGVRLAGDGVRAGSARLEGLIAGKPAPTGEWGVCAMVAARTVLLLLSLYCRLL